MSNHQTLKDLHNATSSQESVDGQEPCSSQDGVQTDLFGQAAPLANHSQQQEREREKMTSDTSGLSSLISSESANLQQCLASKLQQLSDMDGLMIYKTTLKRKVTPQQRSYYHLAASARTTKGTDSSLPPSAWPTPTQRDYKGGRKLNEKGQSCSATTGQRYGLSLDQAPQLVPWLTPTTSDTNGVRRLDGKRSGGLNTQALSAWPTPTHHNSKEGGYPGELTRNTIPLGAMKHMVAWATPNTMDYMAQRSDEALARAKTKGGCSNLKDQIPTSGITHKSSTAETENIAPSQLNPRFSLWLMGYPIEWAYSGEAVTPLSRKRQRKS